MAAMAQPENILTTSMVIYPPISGALGFWRSSKNLPVYLLALML
jgi:hypothetical protein